MKRDMDKVRSFMLALEGSPEALLTIYDIQALRVLDSSDEMIGYIHMLASGGFLEETQRSVYRISWAGHEFLDTIRDPEIWRKTKDGASKVGSWSVKLLADMATGFIRLKAHEMGLPIGG